MLEVVRLLQTELGWLAIINELGSGSAMVYGTRSAGRVTDFAFTSSGQNLPEDG